MAVDKSLPAGIAAYLAKEERDLALGKIQREPSNPTRTRSISRVSLRLSHVVLLFRGWLDFVYSFTYSVLTTLNRLCSRLCLPGSDDNVVETRRLIKSLAEIYVGK